MLEIYLNPSGYLLRDSENGKVIKCFTHSPSIISSARPKRIFMSIEELKKLRSKLKNSEPGNMVNKEVSERLKRPFKIMCYERLGAKVFHIFNGEYTMSVLAQYTSSPSSPSSGNSSPTSPETGIFQVTPPSRSNTKQREIDDFSQQSSVFIPMSFSDIMKQAYVFHVFYGLYPVDNFEESYIICSDLEKLMAFLQTSPGCFKLLMSLKEINPRFIGCFMNREKVVYDIYTCDLGYVLIKFSEMGTICITIVDHLSSDFDPIDYSSVGIDLCARDVIGFSKQIYSYIIDTIQRVIRFGRIVHF